MQAHLPEDKLDKARSMLLGWLSKRVCHLRTSSLLLGPFSLPVGSFPWVGPSCNALSTIHGVFPSQSGSFFSMTISVRIFPCGTFFSITGMVSASFFPLTRKRHQTPTCILMPLGGQVTEPFMIIGSLKANGFLPTSSVPSQRLAQPDRSCTLHDLGCPLGQ